MPRTREQIEQAAADTEAWLDNLDPNETPASDAADLRAIATALRGVADSEQAVAQAVDIARANGRSWTLIGSMLGVSKQAAQARYGTPASTPR